MIDTPRIVGTAIADATGAIVASARATWIEVHAPAFPAVDGGAEAPGAAVRTGLAP